MSTTTHVAMKECSRCGEVKPTKDFGKRASRPDGLTSWCRECKNEYSRQRARRQADLGRTQYGAGGLIPAVERARAEGRDLGLEAWREARIQAWLRWRLGGPGPWDPSARRRALDELALLVRHQVKAGVPTYLTRKRPGMDDLAWTEDDGPGQEDRVCEGPDCDAPAAVKYCSPRCNGAAYRARRR